MRPHLILPCTKDETCALERAALRVERAAELAHEDHLPLGQCLEGPLRGGHGDAVVEVEGDVPRAVGPVLLEQVGMAELLDLLLRQLLALGLWWHRSVEG